MRTLLTTTAFLLMAGVASAATVTIETETSGTALKAPAPDIVGNEVPGGDGDAERPNIEFGQLFTATEDAILVSFGFAIDDATAGENDDFTSELTYRAKVVKVDNLDDIDSFSFDTDGYTSDEVTSSGENDFDPREVHVLTEEFVLEAGMTYAIVFEAISGGPVEWGYFDNSSQASTGEAYADGSFIFSGSDTNDFMAISFFDSDFEVTFETPVIPVAGALPLLATGLAAFGVAGLRRRRKQ